ncbi:hypothetical protein NJB1907f44_50250 [Mycobacterium marinum]|uniref:Uncharacterized protein n=1 Tax=Mycobacterium shottsii TaxID=133549 RepID=A0A7I7LEM7_9MYCO|nr:hypothetical protein [Mycobacterium shottsii]EPQ80195.1 hypothetical protein MMEU_0720 [Mycobacterium marinum str. Europe]BBC65723.1 hypothetical protein MMRN_26190 [Mycobacterium marinum]QYL28510.1 hypothetical protein TM48_02841 [Mycobacterium shottsii]BBX58491.1 hypothetical protein MSHO_38360 [Mycobacterium shottsii]GJN98092.1 hypothetical protein NJB1808e29_15020 [Mycobacterium marinum]
MAGALRQGPLKIAAGRFRVAAESTTKDDTAVTWEMALSRSVVRDIPLLAVCSRARDIPLT